MKIPETLKEELSNLCIDFYLKVSETNKGTCTADDLSHYNGGFSK
jgi:hypothetical protein